MDWINQGTTEAVMGSTFEGYNILGYDFLEKIYLRAMVVELQSRGCKAEAEAEIRVR